MLFSAQLVEGFIDYIEQGYRCLHPRSFVYDAVAWSKVLWPIYSLGYTALSPMWLMGGCAAVYRGDWEMVGGYDELCNPNIDRCAEARTLAYRIKDVYGRNAVKVVPNIVGMSGRRFYRFLVRAPEPFEPIRSYRC